MNISKRFFIFGLFFLIVLALPAKAQGIINIVTSFPHDASITRIIGGKYVFVTSLSKANNDPHAVQPKPSMAVALNKADLLITNGQDMDLAWLPTALSNARNTKILDGQDAYFDPSEGVTLIPYTKDELKDTPFFSLNLITGGNSKDSSGSDILKKGNHHYWLNPENGIILAHNIANKLGEIDPTHNKEFQENAKIFENKLKAKMNKWDKELVKFKGTNVVSYHRDWIYLIKRHGLNLIGYVEPRETIPPSAGELTSLILKMKKENAKIIFTSPWQNQRISLEIARQTNAINLKLPSSVGDEVGVSDYLEMFDVIYSKLITALKNSK